MVGRRIVYGAALLAALAFQIFYDGYLAQFLLVCIILLPVLSLLLSLPGLLGLRLSLSAAPARLLRDQKGQWRIGVDNATPLPVAQLTLDLLVRNALTGAERRKRFRTFGLSGEQARSLPMDCEHCGVLTCRIVRAKALDFLGLISLPVSSPPAVQALVLPEPAPLEDLPSLDRLSAQTGLGLGRGASSEDYDLRGYRPGDPIRSIHWKLSSKHDELVVREVLGGGRPQIFLSFDLFGSPDRLDRVLARLWTASHLLSQQDLPHEICWMGPDGQAEQQSVASQAQLTACMARILSQRAPEAKPQAVLTLPEGPGLAHLHLNAGEEDAP